MPLQNAKGNPLNGGMKYKRGGKIVQISPFVSETLQDRAVATMKH